MKNFFLPGGGYSPRENAIYEWILLVVQKNLPITTVDDNIWRKALKHGEDVWGILSTDR
jgi:hypothetical protein